MFPHNCVFYKSRITCYLADRFLFMYFPPQFELHTPFMWQLKHNRWPASVSDLVAPVISDDMSMTVHSLNMGLTWSSGTGSGFVSTTCGNPYLTVDFLPPHIPTGDGAGDCVAFLYFLGNSPKYPIITIFYGLECPVVRFNSRLSILGHCSGRGRMKNFWQLLLKSVCMSLMRSTRISGWNCHYALRHVLTSSVASMIKASV